MESLHLRIEKGNDLVAADSGGTSDPYVVVTRLIPGKTPGEGQKLGKTKVVKKTVNPVWNDELVIPAHVGESYVLSCFDKDVLKDDSLGFAVLGLDQLVPYNTPKQLVLKLQAAPHGTLTVTATFNTTAVPPPGPTTPIFAPPPLAAAAAAPPPPAAAAAPPPAAALVPVAHPSTAMTEMDPVLLAELGPLGATKFLQSLRQGVAQQQAYAAGAGPAAVAVAGAGPAAPARDYVVILDRSGSMSGTRWRSAEKAISILAPFACRADPDGITFYVFNNSFKRFENVRSATDVEEIFSSTSPEGGTEMAVVLKDLFQAFLAGGKKPTTVLVITDGESSGQETIVDSIQSVSNKLDTDAQLSITFVQIGDDSGASAFLNRLDDQLHCKFDICDVLTVEEMEGMTFDQLVAKSLQD